MLLFLIQKQKALNNDTYLIRIMQLIFKKNISKGTRFNQIYIPKQLENEFEVGDEVEVKLIKKRVQLNYSKKLKLSEFKEDLIKNIFSFLSKSDRILNIFVVGSFLTEKIDYNDIDIVIVTKEKINNFDEIIYNKLIDKFNLKFHVLTIEEQRFEQLLKICPLTQSMFSLYISSKKTSLEREKVIDKNHIKFLLMMPEDLLELELGSKTFLDSVRRLITIERFLENKDLEKINIESEKLLGKEIYITMKNNERIDEKDIIKIREIIKDKLKKIKEMI